MITRRSDTLENNPFGTGLSNSTSSKATFKIENQTEIFSSAVETYVAIGERVNCSLTIYSPNHSPWLLYINWKYEITLDIHCKKLTIDNTNVDESVFAINATSKENREIENIFLIFNVSNTEDLEGSHPVKFKFYRKPLESLIDFSERLPLVAKQCNECFCEIRIKGLKFNKHSHYFLAFRPAQIGKFFLVMSATLNISEKTANYGIIEEQIQENLKFVELPVRIARFKTKLDFIFEMFIMAMIIMLTLSAGFVTDLGQTINFIKGQRLILAMGLIGQNLIMPCV